MKNKFVGITEKCMTLPKNKDEILEFVKSPSPLVAVVGKSVAFCARYRAHKTPTITWEVAGRRIHKDDKRFEVSYCLCLTHAGR